MKLILIFFLSLNALYSQTNRSNNVHLDTIVINNTPLIKILKDDRFICLIYLDRDTIIKEQNYYHRLSIVDFNQDGFDDIRIFVFSNTPNQCDNYLFKPSVKTYAQLECHLNFEKIENTQFYYTYNSTGCSDQNWESDLFKMDSY